MAIIATNKHERLTLEFPAQTSEDTRALVQHFGTAWQLTKEAVISQLTAAQQQNDAAQEKEEAHEPATEEATTPPTADLLPQALQVFDLWCAQMLALVNAPAPADIDRIYFHRITNQEREEVQHVLNDRGRTNDQTEIVEVCKRVIDAWDTAYTVDMEPTPTPRTGPQQRAQIGAIVADWPMRYLKAVYQEALKDLPEEVEKKWRERWRADSPLSTRLLAMNLPAVTVGNGTTSAMDSSRPATDPAG